MIEALLFDNDGVLVNTEPLFYAACRETLERRGFSLSLEAFQRISLVEGRSCLEIARDDGMGDREFSAMRDERNVLYDELLRAGVPLIDGVLETLAALHGRIPMAIVTSCIPHHFDVIHAQHEVRELFEFTLTPDHYGRHKPHPEPYLTAAGRIGAAPERCLVVEDTERGLVSAHRAGMRCLVVPHELTAAANFDLAERVLESIREVPGELERLREGG